MVIDNTHQLLGVSQQWPYAVIGTKVLLTTHLSSLHRWSPLCYRSAADTIQDSSLSHVAFSFAATTTLE